MEKLPEELRKQVSEYLKEHSKEFIEKIPKIIGQVLQQEYKKVNGKWCLFSLGKFARELTEEEVNWHIARNYKPFCINGTTLYRDI